MVGQYFLRVNMGILEQIKTELAGNVPLYGAMTDQQVVDELNNVQFSASGGLSGMVNYLLNNKNRSNTGSDTTPTAIFGRLHHVANANIGDDPFSSTTLVTLEGKHAAQAFLDLLLSTHLGSIDFTESNLPFSVCKDMQIWKQLDVDALIALSQNKQSRAQKLGIPIVKLGHIMEARL